MQTQNTTPSVPPPQQQQQYPAPQTMAQPPVQQQQFYQQAPPSQQYYYPQQQQYVQQQNMAPQTTQVPPQQQQYYQQQAMPQTSQVPPQQQQYYQQQQMAMPQTAQQQYYPQQQQFVPPQQQQQVVVPPKPVAQQPQGIQMTLLLPNGICVPVMCDFKFSLYNLYLWLQKHPHWAPFKEEAMGFGFTTKGTSKMIKEGEMSVYACAQVDNGHINVLQFGIQSFPSMVSDDEGRTKQVLSKEYLQKHKLSILVNRKDLVLLKNENFSMLIEFFDDVSNWACVTDTRLPQPVYVNLGTKQFQFANPLGKAVMNMELLSISTNISKAARTKEKVVQRLPRPNIPQPNLYDLRAQYGIKNPTVLYDSSHAANLAGDVVDAFSFGKKK